MGSVSPLIIRPTAHQSWTHMLTHQIWVLAVLMYPPTGEKKVEVVTARYLEMASTRAWRCW